MSITGKPEGKLLQQILQESDGAKRKPLLEQFATEYPKHDGAAWVLEQLQEIAVKAGDPDQILDAGDRLLAIDPHDPEAGLQNLKAAQSKKDYALMKKVCSRDQCRREEAGVHRRGEREIFPGQRRLRALLSHRGVA